MPFTKATDNYDYIIFAYNDENNTVRYIYCDSLENGADQPYYLELDWCYLFRCNEPKKIPSQTAWDFLWLWQQASQLPFAL